MMLFLAIAMTACTQSPTPETRPTETPAPTEPPAEEVVLTLGGWRTSTGRMNQLLAEFHEDHPYIIVRFDPSESAEYDSVLRAQLEAGTAPDVFYLRSFSASRVLYEEGYVEPLSDLPDLRAHFDSTVLAAWETREGVPYAVPFTATSHGIYYNQDVFQELSLEIPETWEELLEVARRLQEAGMPPFANGTKAEWTAAETIFMNLAPSFLGGREGRMAYLAGERCFNDDAMVSAFQAVQDLAPFFPENHELLGYIDSLQLFVQGKAAMWMSGSWDIPYFEEADPDFAWSVFPVPPPTGQPCCVTFHLDVGIGLNRASDHKDEAEVFLTWMTRPEFGALLGNEMPGFFSMHRDPTTLENEHANAFLALNQGRDTDIRFVWEKLREGSPSAYTLIQNGTLQVLQGELAPQEAADALQAGLATWFEPAQTCDE
jgi:raffinose/stachyose/melibiose transport system substrate-binding protein